MKGFEIGERKRVTILVGKKKVTLRGQLPSRRRKAALAKTGGESGKNNKVSRGGKKKQVEGITRVI